MRDAWSVLTIAAVTVLLGTPTAVAQPAANQRKWDIEIHGGGMFAINPTDGTVGLPAPGPPITPVLGPPFGTSRIVPSWYFGDGASLLNQALTSLRFGSIVSPLDQVLQSRLVRRQSGASVGFRFGRSITPRFDAELSVDYDFGALALTSGSDSGIETSRASFATAWNVLTAGPSRGTANVSSVAAISDHRGRQVVTTGTLVINLSTSSSVKPYLVAGAGVISRTDGSPEATLVGDYRFGLVFPPGITPPVGPPTFHETDTVVVRSSTDTAPAGVFGGGLKVAVSNRWGVRIDVRDHVSRDKTTTLLDATPAAAALTPSGVLLLTLDPRLQFSTVPGVPTSLSGTPLAGFQTFSGSGVEHHINLAAGLFWRF
ncbi:MAG: hypothetical protein C5B57_11050 [Blastocatellia bacterium]|nr:MAG: hypothetical protein C5B57_11050 [Blastocatellia bacterium]